MNVAGWRASAISGALVGSLYALNAWDLPTFLLLVAIGVWIGAGATISRAWKPLLLLAVAAVAAWLPFLATYVPPDVRRRARAAGPDREVTGRLQPHRGRRPAPGRTHLGDRVPDRSSACHMRSVLPS